VPALSAGTSNSGSLPFGEGAALARERSATHLVFVHGSDWNLLGERLKETVWESSLFVDLAEKAGLVLSDVDVLQSPDDAARAANDLRNEGWKGTGLVTYPAFIAFDAQGRLIGSRQGAQLPRDPVKARVCLFEFVGCLRRRAEFEGALAAARAAGETAEELALLLSRDELPLERAPDLLERLRSIQTDEARRAAAKVGFPDWFALVRDATNEAKAGEGAAAEQRLRAMLAEPAYTDEQRATVWFALGSAYRRWEGHDAQAAEAFRTAWRSAPDGLLGIAGRRMYLELYGGPSVAFGWAERHLAGGKLTWIVEDLPPILTAGTWRLLWRASKGDAPALSKARLVCGERVVTGTGDPEGGQTVLFILDAPLEAPALHIDCAAPDSAASKGTLEWERVR
jgi:hypothetical protein